MTDEIITLQKSDLIRLARGEKLKLGGHKFGVHEITTWIAASDEVRQWVKDNDKWNAV